MGGGVSVLMLETIVSYRYFRDMFNYMKHQLKEQNTLNCCRWNHGTESHNPRKSISFISPVYLVSFHPFHSHFSGLDQFHHPPPPGGSESSWLCLSCPIENFFMHISNRSSYAHRSHIDPYAKVFGYILSTPCPKIRTPRHANPCPYRVDNFPPARNKNEKTISQPGVNFVHHVGTGVGRP